MKRSRSIVVTCALALTILATACAKDEALLPGTPGEPTYSPGDPLLVTRSWETPPSSPDTATEDPPQPGGAPDRGPFAYANEETLTIVTVSSGSCPLIAEVRDVDHDRKIVTVELTPTIREACTADFAPRTFTFTLDESVAGFSVDLIAVPADQGT